ncbi:MAG: hypothetical protein AABX70_06220 [Nanoarchaeota archaeon]
MDAIRGIEDFVSHVESHLRHTLDAPSPMSDHWAARFLDNQYHGVLGPDEFEPRTVTSLFSGRKSWPMKILPPSSEGTFQVGFGVIRTLIPYASEVTSLLGHITQLAHAPALVSLGETRGYLRLDYDSERGYGETRIYVTDPEFTSFNRLMYQTHGLRNDDAPDFLRRPGEDPPSPTFPEKMPLELIQGVDQVMTCLKTALLPFAQYESVSRAVDQLGDGKRRKTG